MVARKWPWASATVRVTDVALARPGCPAEITTVAPGAVVPVTAVRAVATVVPARGEVIETWRAAGRECRT